MRFGWIRLSILFFFWLIFLTQASNKSIQMITYFANPFYQVCFTETISTRLLWSIYWIYPVCSFFPSRISLSLHVPYFCRNHNTPNGLHLYEDITCTLRLFEHVWYSDDEILFLIFATIPYKPKLFYTKLNCLCQNHDLMNEFFID